MPDHEAVAWAKTLVLERFPQARAAWLGGSVAAGTETPGSDLDITVLLAGPPAPFRSSVLIAGHPVEFFVQTEDSLMRFCADDVRRRRPTTMRLVGCSVLLIDADGSGVRLQRELKQLDTDVPPALSETDSQSRRYAISDLATDLRDARDDAEALIVAAALVREAGDFLLAAHRRWSGSGKWLLMELTGLDGQAGTDYASSLVGGLQAVARGDRESLHAAVIDALNQFGGPVFDGYQRTAPP